MQANKADKNKILQFQELPGDPFRPLTVDHANRLALQAAANSQYFLAEHQLKQLAGAFPKVLEFRLRLLELAVVTGKGATADALIRELEKLKIKRAELLPWLYERAVQNGDADTALEHGRKLVQLAPHSAQAHFALGQAHTAMGEKEEAIAAFDAVISRAPTHARPYYFRGLLLKQNLNDKQRKQLDDALVMAHSRDVYSFGYLHLAKAWSHYGDVDSEFMYLDRAKQKMAEGATWNADRLRKDFQDIASFSNAQQLKTAQALAISDQAPVFIIAMGRSGTTLLESILAAHSDFVPTGERGFVTKACDQVGLSIGKIGAFWQWGGYFSLEDLLARLHRQISQHEALQALAGRRWLDKSLGSYYKMGLIKMIYPRAKFIHIKRNPMAVCLSNYQHWMGAGNQVPLTLEQLAQQYQLINGFVEHWMTLFADDILSIDFSRLTEDFEKELRKILSFLGVEWNEACLKFNERKTVILTPSTMQVRAAINQDAENRWMLYGKHLQPVAKILNL